MVFSQVLYYDSPQSILLGEYQHFASLEMAQVHHSKPVRDLRFLMFRYG